MIHSNNFWKSSENNCFVIKTCILFQFDTFSFQGNALFKAGKYEEAINRYTAGINFDPTNAILPANRAMCLLKLQRSVCLQYVREARCRCTLYCQ